MARQKNESVAPSGTPTNTVNLGSAEDFVILSKAGISTVPSSVITGSIAVSPIAASAITGFNLAMDASNTFSTASQVSGKVKAPDYTTPTGPELTTAVSDMETAYKDAAARFTTSTPLVDYLNRGAGEIGGATLAPGVYTFDTDVNISADLTFSGTSEDVFVIQTSKSIIQATSTQVVLEGGALAENIFWAVAQEVNVGADSHIEGIILAKTAVTFNSSSSLKGRIFSQTAVTLQKAIITQP
ncbi:antifreeze protein [Fragilariopsis cylindrus CCMP1102]|uniref:Antifreeze protein n=1 Tax=Fragilariopsis cylindrus CCMP1102 TaxID=635003 RepID=A0A1E7EZ38_9STRA|nr:antifreeze protein [Fragilariopsis cylindrus CCMP1102]|eukprot:OEU11089.1 antifreeze protein [Fragilariopsis cylindrus CCMP1102]